MADENITDLTQPEQTDGEETAEKEPKEKKEKQKKEKKKPEEGKKKSGIGVILVMLAVAVILAGGYVAALLFNVLNARAITAELLREPLINTIVWLDPKFTRIDFELRDIAQARENDLNDFEEELLKREEELLAREAIANTREDQLDRRATEIEKREEEFWKMYERAVPIYRRDMTPEELEEMESIALTFTNMSPASAADILYRLYTLQDTAEILYYMTEKQRAPILDAFDRDFAAEITNFWLYN